MQTLEEEYGPGAEQICTECCFAAFCYFHKKYPKIKGCSHYYGEAAEEDRQTTTNTRMAT